jgi:NifU-like protein involved in Fe-S cluster formation
MDEVVAERYRELMHRGFPNTGSLDNPTMFIDTKAEGISICGQGGEDFMNIYIRVIDGVIARIKYLCMCDPTANVIVETLCQLAEGKTLEEAKVLTKEQFFAVIGSDGGGVRRKVWGALELLNRVINRWEGRGSQANGDVTK